MRKAHNIFEPKASRVLRALLVDPNREWTFRGLAGDVGISLGHLHAVVSSLLEFGYVGWTEDRHLRAVDPKRLLRRWAAYNQYDKMNKFHEYYTLEREVSRFVRKLVPVKRIHYALTALAGALLVAPHVRPADVHIYASEVKDVKRLVELLDLKPVERGGNVKLVIPYDDGVFYHLQVIDGVNVVSNVQLYVDLYNYPARGEEAAAQLFDRILQEWSRSVNGERLVR
jgi:hypothetical protein